MPHSDYRAYQKIRMEEDMESNQLNDIFYSEMTAIFPMLAILSEVKRRRFKWKKTTQ